MGKLDCHGATHQGFVKQANKDQFLIADVFRALEIWQTSLTIDDHSRVPGKSLGKLMVVADGLGSPESASRASVVTIEQLMTFALNHFTWDLSLGTDVAEQWRTEIIEAFWSCQESIAQEANVLANNLDRDIASCVAMGVVNWPTLHLAWVGDCRCYRLRNATLEQLTSPPPSLSPSMESQSVSVGEAAADFTIGGNRREMGASVGEHELRFGDTILFSTNGLSEHLPDQRIKQILESPITAADCCNELINEVLLAGGNDNVTVIVGRFLDQAEKETLALAAEQITKRQTAVLVDQNTATSMADLR